jgi:hypothetical protein
MDNRIEVTRDELEIARKAVEDELIERRDSRLGLLRRNGLCVAEMDGTPSPIIRMGIEEALDIGLKAINAARREGSVDID